MQSVVKAFENPKIGRRSSRPCVRRKAVKHDADLALVGFSQGTMMSLFVGLRRAKPLAGIVDGISVQADLTGMSSALAVLNNHLDVPAIAALILLAFLGHWAVNTPAPISVAEADTAQAATEPAKAPEATKEPEAAKAGSSAVTITAATLRSWLTS